MVGGALVTADAGLHERFRFLQNATGPVPGPFDAYLVLRGLKTLALRLGRHCINALLVAEHLDAHPAVEEVFYPGLASDAGHDLAERQMTAYGGMVAFRPRGGPDAARRVAAATGIFLLGESLGGVESLIEVPAAMTHLSVEGTPLEVPADLVRLSVGIEHIEDLLEDLDRALG